ncbi:hypothetical protein LTR10_009575 [Elasticomyces elasticus]|nr:hypothetical protein LTR10_009575 [Elasticomyces elasticus]KAK4971330.1 hypothetical protein LTR42_007056 [Elasticomyces elasticus]
MDKLPPEVLGHIARECNFTSLKQLRLVNKQISAVTTPIIFEHFYMGYFIDKGLESFCEFAKSPLAKHVKAFTFCADLLPNYTWGSWHRHAVGCEFDYEPVRQYPEDKLNTAWNEFQKLHAEQTSWTEDREGFKFKRHFDMLPNIIEAHISRADMILVSPSDWKKHDLSLSREEQDQLHLAEGQPALCLLEAIGYLARSDGRKQITTLTMYKKHLRSYMDLLGTTVGQGGNGRTEPSSPAHHLRYRDILEAFKPLETIKLFHRRASGCGVTALEELGHLLCQAKSLQRLEIQFVQSNIRFMDEWTIDDVFSLSPLLGSNESQDQASADLKNTSILSAHWPELHHLHLSTNVNCPGFLSFLRRHSATLRSLELRDMIVGDVAALLREIPKVLGLDHVKVSSLWGPNPDFVPDVNCQAYHVYLFSDLNGLYEKTVKEYLLRQRGEFPELVIEGGNGKGFVDSDYEIAMDAIEDEDYSEEDDE